MTWEDIYARGEQMNSWPWSDLVRLVKRNVKVRGMSVLELGCGPSIPNARFFIEEGAASYTGVDYAMGSHLYRYTEQDTAICRMGGDFTKFLPDGPYDLIVDRAAVTHNTTEDIENCLALVRDRLKPDGLYIGSDWFAMDHSDCGKGVEIDEYTFDDAEDGQFKGLLVHFSDAGHILSLFSDFEIVSLELKRRVDVLKTGRVVATWDLVAKKHGRPREGSDHRRRDRTNLEVCDTSERRSRLTDHHR